MPGILFRSWMTSKIAAVGEPGEEFYIGDLWMESGPVGSDG